MGRGLVAVGLALATAGMGAALACGSAFTSTPYDGGSESGSDGASEASAEDGDDGGFSPCSHMHTFCEDFDSVDSTAALAAKWMPGPGTSSGGVLQIVDMPVVSSPHALRAFVPASAGNYQGAQLQGTFPVATGNFAGVTCELDFRVSGTSGSAAVSGGLFSLSVVGAVGDPVANAFALFNVNGALGLGGDWGSTSALDAGQPRYYPGIGSLAAQRWTHLAVTIVGGATGSVSASLDKAQPATQGLPMPTIASRVDIKLEALEIGQSSPFDFTFDNVFCELAQ